MLLSNAKKLQLDAHRTTMRMRTFAGITKEQIRIFGDMVKMAQLGKLNLDQFPYETISEIA